jgi:hypothetical protein
MESFTPEREEAMTLTWKTRGALLGLLAGFVVLVGGCGQTEPPAKKDADKPVAKKGETKHDDWWCTEHGIPEDECSMCRATANAKKLARECKAKGDWCDKHDRALSQCFICNPKRREFYAAKYRARYGKEPPPIEDDEKK